MRSTRISPLVVAVIGIVLCLAAAGGIAYFLVMPTQQAADSAQARYTAAAPDATPAAQAKAQKDLVQARVDVANTKAQWAVYESTIMPPYDVSHRYAAWQQLQNELALNLGPDLTKFFHQKGGVVPLSSVSLPAPPASPNAITAAPLVIPISGSSTGGGGGFSGGGFGGGGFGGGGFGGGGGTGGSGSISVGGSFRQILHHVQLWNNFNRLVLIDNLALHGNSPYMAGNYGATVIIFPQNDDKLDKELPAASTGAASGPGGFGPTGG